MRAGRRFTFSPATALALVALFFALGGSALAVGERVQASSAVSSAARTAPFAASRR